MCVCGRSGTTRVSLGGERCVFREAQSDGSAVRRAVCAPSAQSDVCVGGCTMMVAPRRVNLICFSGCTGFFGIVELRVCQTHTVREFEYRLMVNVLWERLEK